jgi:hypothetical protein
MSPRVVDGTIAAGLATAFEAQRGWERSFVVTHYANQAMMFWIERWTMGCEMTAALWPGIKTATFPLP